MNSDLDISIIIPWYNTELVFVKRALDSVQQQIIEIGFEVVICDDGSEKNNLERIKKLIEVYSFPIVLCSHKDNKGISAARNSAVEQSHGNWLIWLDADDELLPNTISQFLLERERCKANYFISKCLVIEGENVECREPKIYFNRYKDEKTTLHNPFITSIFSLQAQMIKKELFFELGGFDINYKYAEITELFLRYVWKNGINKFKYVDEYLYKYYRTQASHSTNRKQLENQRIELLLKYAKRFNLNIEDLQYLERNKKTGAHEYIAIPSKMSIKL